MKKLLLFTFRELATATLLIGITVGLGTELHSVFFVVVLAIAMAVLAQAIADPFANGHP
jgi:hypothetical protein